jgi:hypothetical protein
MRRLILVVIAGVATDTLERNLRDLVAAWWHPG